MGRQALARSTVAVSSNRKVMKWSAVLQAGGGLELRFDRNAESGRVILFRWLRCEYGGGFSLARWTCSVAKLA
jgi:hypothetical protein